MFSENLGDGQVDLHEALLCSQIGAEILRDEADKLGVQLLQQGVLQTHQLGGAFRLAVRFRHGGHGGGLRLGFRHGEVGLRRVEAQGDAKRAGITRHLVVGEIAFRPLWSAAASAR